MYVFNGNRYRVKFQEFYEIVFPAVIFRKTLSLVNIIITCQFYYMPFKTCKYIGQFVCTLKNIVTILEK